VVVTLHELAGPVVRFVPGLLRRLWLLPLVFWADAVIATNERDFFLLNKAPFLKKILHYIPLVSNIEVRQDIDRQAVRRKLQVNDDEILLLRFGFINNIRVSFLLELIQAIKNLCNKGYKVRLVLVGGVGLKDSATILSFATSLGIAERVILTGYCSSQEVSQYLGSADIGVQLNSDGVFRSTTILATMSHGLPTIGLKKGYVPAVFVNRENILLLLKSDPEHIARGIKELILDEALRERLSRKSIQAVAGFNGEMVAKLTSQLYSSLFAGS
jgi:glycosyltransferase involved in cell wall biosynthesis